MKNVSKRSHITKGDVFDDLGLSHAEVIEAKVKADLWRELMGHLKPLPMTQKELAKCLSIHQPDVSHLLNGRLSKFSVGSLIQYAVKLGLGVQVKLTAAKPERGKVKSLSAKGRKEQPRSRDVAATAA